MCHRSTLCQPVLSTVRVFELESMPRVQAMVDCIAQASVDDVASILLHFIKCTLDKSVVEAAQLSGAKLVQHDNVVEFLDAVEAEDDDYVEYLRLFSACKYMHKYKRLPSDACAADDIAKLAPEVADKFRELRFTEEMMREVDPVAFRAFVGMKFNVLKKLKEQYILLVEPRDGVLVTQ